jgi:hypothetical protein
MFNYLDVLEDFSCLRFNQNNTLLFQHIPKTNGNSIIHRLRTELFVKSLYVYHKNGEEQLDAYFQLPSAYQVKFISGHINTKQINNITPAEKTSIDIFTWIRHPISRMISNYYSDEFFKFENQVRYSNLEEYVKAQPENVMLNNWLLSKPCQTLPDVLDDLKDRYSFIGVTEKNDICAYILGTLMEICQSPLPYLNKKTQSVTYSNHILGMIQEKSRLDIAFYNYLVGRYENITGIKNKIKECSH